MQNKAIITGASRGIGKAIALLLAQQGYKVLLLARNAGDLAKVQSEVEQSGGQAETYPVDISQAVEVKNTIDHILAKHPKIDYLINNAGVGTFKAIENIEITEWEQIMNLNARGSFLLCKYLLPVMKQQKSGHIVTIASDVSKRTFAHGSVYCASKYAQEALMASIRKEVRNFGVKVSTIYPGMVDTYFNDGEPGSAEKANLLKPEDIAEAVNYILKAPAHVVVDELMLHPLEQEY